MSIRRIISKITGIIDRGRSRIQDRWNVMRFMDERAIRQIRRCGVVSTLRTYRYIEYQRTRVVIGEDEKRTAFIVRAIYNPTVEDLKTYLPVSGFSSVDEWLETARKLHKREPRVLCLVYVPAYYKPNRIPKHILEEVEFFRKPGGG